MSNETSVARRRFLQGATAVAVIGFDPVRRSWITEAKAGGGLSRLPRLDGQLVTTPAALAEAGDDYGHIIKRTPVAVLRPGSIDDVVEMVRYADMHRLRIAMRGQGHSTHGQSQVEAGIVIDSRTMNQIHEVKSGYAVVGPGARWREIVAATLPRGLTPPTLPNYLDLTVGGNIAVGGVGGASHRHGAVVDNILELEVVTGTGQLRRCSPTQNATLFNSVLAGLGQFGIVVRARIKLIPAKQLVRLYTIQYPDVPSFLDDARIVTIDERFDHVEGQINADASGRYGAATMFAAKYFDPGAPPNDAALLDNLDFASHTADTIPYGPFLERIDPIIDFLKAVGAWTLPHPWFDTFLPSATAEQFMGELFSSVTTADTGNANVLLYPLKRSKFRQQFLRVPGGDDLFFLFDVLTFAPPVPAVVDQWVARNTTWHKRAEALGAKRYNIGSANLTQQDWKNYFSPHWAAALLAKQAYDPKNILTPGQGIFPSSFGC